MGDPVRTRNVRAIDMGAETIKLKHDPIPALGWPAMTMAFPVQSKDLIKGLEVPDGDSATHGGHDWQHDVCPAQVPPLSSLEGRRLMPQARRWRLTSVPQPSAGACVAAAVGWADAGLPSNDDALERMSLSWC